MEAATPWPVLFHDEFDPEFDAFDESAQDALLAAAKAVMIAGPKCGRPAVDTLKGSRHANMKELRYTACGGSKVWRAAFAFDTVRQAVILCAAAKQGTSSKLFYKRLIAKADDRFDSHEQNLQRLQKRS
ncbi:type II toxin-antitoxin system RelE/ParE family toxin [Ramlibacter albus]|uniref:Type II toxin-antitoxin system RelE/ParE family toxin n=1 Tax=Ramlibacter albus TaxID=2079448 RepID=A0A923MAG6_9BURK|nr:type II toxin-antitoxin system RelE/ParE family toxin [Ramlibacter albus]MBC5765748.1 type II toxin-antitoxin system RelE/ParE family toxin [Ramlibacter albus]